nr:RNA-directed DNA polymerase, eukaryota, reverse transcriptase zinc-binding domain protein [Tanacetum cinerariifolium]
MVKYTQDMVKQQTQPHVLFEEVVEKVKTRLSKWKIKTLSIGGRFTLLKYVLGSIPIFHMSIFRVPSRVLQILESIRGRFFNGHEIGSKKMSWVKWNNVLTDKKRGGLGVSSLYALNKGLMIKWLWKFFLHKDSLWTKVITAIHGVNGNVNSSGEKAGRSCWLAIVDEVRALHKKGVYVFDFMNLKLGNGEMVKFWLDRWYEGCILKDLFPRMFALENMKEVTVSSKLNGDNLADSFSPAFVEANFKMLESLMKDYRRQAQDEGLWRKRWSTLERITMKSLKRNLDLRPMGKNAQPYGLGLRSFEGPTGELMEAGAPLQPSMASGYVGNMPSIDQGGNPPPNGMYAQFRTQSYPHSLYPPMNGQTSHPSYAYPYTPHNNVPFSQPSTYQPLSMGGNPSFQRLDICPSSYILIFLVLRVYMLLGFRSAVSPKGLSLRMCSLFSYGYPILIVVPFVYKVCRNCEFGLAILSEGEGDSLNFFIGDLPPLLPHRMRTMDN